MRLSKYLLPTLKEKPKDAKIKSHILLIRAGYIKPLSAGVYNYLPMGWRVLKKVMNIIREEMDNIGAQELMLPSINPAEVWRMTNRWDTFGNEMFRFKDRKNHDMCLAPTHEEIITYIAKDEIKSYRDLPQSWYQIQWKFRDEPRPRSGVLRARQFIMKDSYSLDASQEGLDESYNKHKNAYMRIFKRSGLDTFIVGASSGLMGGSGSEEFMAPSSAGEDIVIKCSECNYATNVEVAEYKTERYVFNTEKDLIEKVHTPVAGDVESIAKFFSTSPKQLLKSLLFIANEKPIFVLIPGDRSVIEDKLMKVLGSDVRAATEEEVKKITGAPAGYISPYGLKDIDVYLDLHLKNAKGLITGANESEYHIVNVTPERDFNIKELADLTAAKDGDKCPLCGGEIKELKTIEVGHIFKLGTKYSKAMDAVFSDKDGKKKVIIMGSYGIGVERIMATAVEQRSDDKGIIWPITIAPFEIILLNLDVRDREINAIAEEIYINLKKENIEVLYDDRDISPGMKFKDADLIGIPFRINIGKKSIEKGGIEFIRRETGEKKILPVEEIIMFAKEQIEAEHKKYEV